MNTLLNVKVKDRVSKVLLIEWMFDWLNAWFIDLLNEWMNEYVSNRRTVLVRCWLQKDWIIDWMNTIFKCQGWIFWMKRAERVSLLEWIIDRLNEWLIDWTNAWILKWMIKWMHKWIFKKRTVWVRWILNN